jgi:predicted  nucleic acid-binding Zn-ribbon protein
MLQSQKRVYERNLHQLNNQIATTSRILNSLRVSCERKRKEIENLNNEKARLEAIITEFTSDNEDYLDKIKQAAYEVRSILSDSKSLLQFATLSIIEALRINPELCNFIKI